MIVRHRDLIIFSAFVFLLILFNIAWAMADEMPFNGAAAVAEGELQRISGGADLSMLALADQNGTVSNNSVNGNSVTGTIQFDGQAFQNLNGMAVISANTGNNVSINSSFQVNIAIGSTP